MAGAWFTIYCGSIVGIDDFALKKRHSYGTIVVDHVSHDVVAVPDGRDGKSLKEWLKKNKQITTVTRDRASAYSKAVEEVLPACMQIADRFHIHQNLMEAVNKVLGREIPQTMIVANEAELIPTGPDASNNVDNDIQISSVDTINEEGKKIVPIMDNYTDAEVRRLKVIREIQRLYEQKVSKREISRLLSVNRHTVAKYITGDPEVLCRTYKSSELDGYKEYIIKEINKGLIANEVARKIIASGFSGSFSNIRQYIAMIIKQYGLSAEKRKSNTIPGTNGYKKKSEHTIITRKGIFVYLWMNGQLTTTHRENLCTQYSTLPVLEKCVRSFREIFATQNVALLYIFIERYEKSEIKELASFARGLQKDLEAVENAVSSDLSNGLIEGTNNKVKMIKRTMYGRCSKQLLESILMLSF